MVIQLTVECCLVVGLTPSSVFYVSPPVELQWRRWPVCVAVECVLPSVVANWYRLMVVFGNVGSLDVMMILVGSKRPLSAQLLERSLARLEEWLDSFPVHCSSLCA